MLVSFIIPTFNSEKTIKICIESIKKQDCRKEIIVVDGNSRDKTIDIVKRFDIRLIIEKKIGIAPARNTGLRESKGDYIAFVDSDVVLPEDWITKALKFIEGNKKIAAVGGPGKSYEKNTISDSLNFLLFGNSSLVKNKFVDSIATMDVLYKRKAIEGMIFDESMFLGEDPEFNFRLRKRGFKLLYDRNLWVYHQHPTKFVGLLRKWYNYGKSYPLLGSKHKEIRNIQFYLRIFYIPAFFSFILSSIFYYPLIYLAFLQIFTIFLYYLFIGIRLCRGLMLFAFPFIHTSKQLSHMIGHVAGLKFIILRE